MLKRRISRFLALSLAALLLGAQTLAAPRPLVTPAAPVPSPKAPTGDRAASGPLLGSLSYGPGDRVAEVDEEFVVDSGYPLDYYLFRGDGPILFDIEISRYFGPVDGDGHLLHPENVHSNNGMVDLTLRLWDVDEDYAGDDIAPEVDKVYVNGTYVGTLSGWNDQWSTVTLSVPVSTLRFPHLDEQRTVVPASNTIRIDIDTANVGVCECWAVAVDWTRLVLRGVRPALLVHGFISDAGTWDAWTTPTGFADQAGLPAEAFSFPNNTGSWAVHMNDEAGWVAEMKERLGVEKINIVGHSKGGLDSRAYLAFLAGDDVENLIMLGTPNGGSPLADLLEAVATEEPTLNGQSLEPALSELSEAYMQNIFNLLVGRNPKTDYYTVAGDWMSLINGNPLIDGRDDGVVAVASVEWLPYTLSLGRTGSRHDQMTSGTAERDLALPVLRQDALTVNSLPGNPLVTTKVVTTSGASSLQLSLLEGHHLAGGSQSHPVALEAGSPGSIGLIWLEGSPNITLFGPDGQELTAGDPGVTVTEEPVLEYNTRFYRIESPQAGDYQVVVSSPDPLSYAVVAASPESPLSVSAEPRQPLLLPGEPAVLEATVTAPAGSPLLAQVEATVRAPDGSLTDLTIHDDGTGPDLVAGDQVFTGEYLPGQAGYHVAVVTAGTPQLQRITTTGFLVLSGEDRFLQVAGHHGVDDDGDGLFDQLAVTLDLTSQAGGSFLYSMRLEADGQSIAQVGGPLALPPGSSQLALTFDGQSLGESGFTGDLILSGTLLRGDGQIADVRVPLAVLSGYSAEQFEHAPLRLLPGIQEQAVDADQDGQYDALQVMVPVEVEGGTYHFNARLVDGNLQEIAWAGGSATLVAGENSLLLSFPGEAIGGHGVDGPYHLRDFSLYGSGHSLSRVELHTTQAYAFTQFEGAALQEGVHLLDPLNPDQSVTLPAGEEFPIRFRWMLGGQPTLDESVTIRIRDGANRLVAGYTYGYGITYDPAIGEYVQPFLPARYGLEAGDEIRVLIYFGGKLQATAQVSLN
ncbi:MAG: lipase family alpha/beta hydrolase [Bacillota bacterium]